MDEKNSKTAIIRPFILKSTKSKKGYRSFYDIKAEILNLAQKGVIPYRIFLDIHTTYLQINKYLKNLNDTGFLNVQEIEGHKVYTTTEKGIKWLQAYQQLKEIK
jgi:predicted transcriptional regulator